MKYIPNFRAVNWRIVGGTLGLATVIVSLCGLGAYAIVQSTHPDKKVREGRVIERKFIPAHDESYTVQVYDGETCYPSYDSYTKSYKQNCTSHYHTEWRTDHIPDAWWVKVEGCKRLKAADPLETCEKMKVRRVWVDQEQYNQLNIGATWHEISS